MKAMMQAGARKDQNRERPFWFVIVATGIIALSVTACATKQSAAALINEGRYKEAEAILIPKAESGDYQAQVHLYHIYNKSRFGFEQDQEKATYWLLKSTENPTGPVEVRKFLLPGDMKELAQRYEEGIGTPQDLNKACYWYKKAALALGCCVEKKVEECVKAGFLPH